MIPHPLFLCRNRASSSNISLTRCSRAVSSQTGSAESPASWFCRCQDDCQFQSICSFERFMPSCSRLLLPGRVTRARVAGFFCLGLAPICSVSVRSPIRQCRRLRLGAGKKIWCLAARSLFGAASRHLGLGQSERSQGREAVSSAGPYRIVLLLGRLVDRRQNRAKAVTRSWAGRCSGGRSGCFGAGQRGEFG